VITGADPGGLTRLIDEFAGIGRAVPVVLGRDLIKHCAVTAGGRSWQTCHSWAFVTGGNLSHGTSPGTADARAFPG
jgi:predicted ATPase